MDDANTPIFIPLTSEPAPYFNVTGTQAAQALQRDAVIQRLRGFRTQPSTPEYQQLLEAFKANPATGCSTVLDQLRRKAGYNPRSPEPNRLMMFYVYLVQHPLFTQVPFDAFETEFKVGMGQPTPNPDEVIRRFQASNEEASKRIRQQYDFILREALSNRGLTQESDLLQEHSIGVRDRITFLYIHTNVKANLNMLPPYGVIGSIVVARYGMEFAFDTAKWPSYAEAVLQEDLKTLDDWLNGF
jgi:hypothetical protein